MRITQSFSLAVLAVSLVAAAPAAAVDFDSVSMEVATRGLNLADAGDVARLEARIGRAATSVCAAPGTWGAAALRAFNECRQSALANGRLKMERAIAAASGAGAGNTRVARR